MDKAPPRIRTTRPLPFNALTAEDFERMCFWLVKREGFDSAEYLGEAGSDQGRDIVASCDGRRFVFQCKRVRRFGPKAVEAEIAKLRQLPSSEQPDEIVFVVSRAMSPKARKMARDLWGKARCHFWTGAELDERTKRHPNIVAEFFDLGVQSGGLKDTSFEPAKRPTPSYPDVATRKLAEALESAYRERAELSSSGRDTTAVTQEILGLRRRLREGAQLKAGDFLLDGRFQLLETIGQGGFGQVWKAFDGSTRQLVAVKVLHGQHTGDQSRCDRFFRGARQMAKLGVCCA